MKTENKDKFITLRISEEKREKAHKASKELLGISLSEFLMNKIEFIINDNEWEGNLKRKGGARKNTRSQSVSADAPVSQQGEKEAIDGMVIIGTGINPL